MTGAGTALPDALDLLDAALADGERRRLVDALLAAGGASKALGRLRGTMAAHALRPGGAGRALEKAIRKLDQRTRQDGFHVLHSWNPRTHRFTDDIVPVLMLDHFERLGDGRAPGRAVLEILLDYYLLHVLTLCAMRAWDAGDPDAALDRVTGLLERLQGPDGSGHRFVRDAETLIIYALSQFHPDERAYDRVIDRVRTLRPARQVDFALPSAAVLSAHLRWGFWLMYGRDVVRMRADNVGDYPWLLASVATLLREYARSVEDGAPDARRDEVVGGLLLGLAADPWAFTGSAPSALAARVEEHAEVRGLIERHGEALLDALEAHRPTKEAYAPLSLHFNFPHNALVALLSMALASGQPQRLPLNALFEREGPEDRVELARAMTAFAGGAAERLGAHGAMLVAYDPYSGLRAFTMTVDTLRKAVGAR